jgi:dihydrofolate reductase
MISGKILGIAACDPQGVMGRKGKLPWHCPEELQHFRDTIQTSPLIMGYRTFLTLPAHYFEKRIVIVFTHHKLEARPNLISLSSLEEFLALEGTFKELYVVGGAQIFSLFLKAKLIQAFILTKMKNLYEGDTIFPLSLLKGWSSRKMRETSEFIIEEWEPVHAD